MKRGGKRLKARHRAIIWLATALGGAGGALAAVANRTTPTPEPVAAASFKPVAEISPSQVPPAPARASAAISPPPPEPAAPEPAPAASAVPAKPELREIPAVALPPPPTNAEELQRTEIACYEDKQPDQCQRAAIAYETGSAGPQSAAQGKNFRKIALNFYVKECEKGLPHACFVLAGMYRSGTLVEASERQVKVLLKRALHLCTLRTAEECKLAGL